MLAMLALSHELLVLPDDNYKRRLPGGPEFAATYLLPLSEAAQRPRLSGWPATGSPHPITCLGPAGC
jgi:hypothetical protein